MKRLTARGKVISAVASLCIAVTLSVSVESAASDPAPPGRPISWLAAGDSYSSGEGLPNFIPGCAQADGTDSKVWEQEAHDVLAQSGKLTTSRFDFTACSGARTGEFFSQQGSNPAEWDGRTRYDLITFTFGGDDANFKSFLMNCLFLVCPSDSSTRDTIRTVGNDYRAFLERISDNASVPGGNILVLGYPELIEDPNQWTGIPQLTDICQGLGRAQADEIRGLAGYLNQALGEAVSIVNSEHPNGVTLHFLDVNSGGSLGISGSDPRLFEPSSGTRHNLCGQDSWMNGLTSIDGSAGSYHPKQAAHDNEASMVEQVLTSQMNWSETQGQPSQPVTPPANNPPTMTQQPLSFAVTGSCTTAGGRLVGASRGFTPGAGFTVAARYPNGEAYTNIVTAGSVHADGTVTWTWDCAGDPPGHYTTQLTDDASARSTGWVGFDIGASPTPPTTPVPPTTSSPAPPTSRPPTTSPPKPTMVTVFDNYGAVTTPGTAMCAGNPNRPESMPSGSVAQTFVVGSGVAVLSSATVQIDPNPSMNVHATLAVNGNTVASSDQAPAGDTTFAFGQVRVENGQQVTLTLTWSGTVGKLDTIYTTGSPANSHLVITNTCSDYGSPHVTDTTATGLRAQVFGTTS